MKVRKRYTLPILRSVSHRVWASVTRRPAAYYALFALRGKNNELAVTESTDIVMEGYGGSANTFAQLAFESCQSRPVEIARHLHVPAQIIRGLELRKPVLVYIRDPLAACASTLSRNTERYSDKTLERSLRDGLRRYDSFYSAVLPYKDEIILAHFDEIISDFGEITKRVNDKFTTNFDVFNHTVKNALEIKSMLVSAKPGSHRMNSPERIQRLIRSPVLEPYREQALHTYNEMLS